MKVIVAVTGASGSVYARQVIDRLMKAGVHVGLIVSRHGAEVAEWENVNLSNPSETLFSTDTKPRKSMEVFNNDNMFSSPASGSASWDAMVIVPCSMGCVGRIAAGVSTDLIARAADVMLKEGRPLIVVPRETPLSLIHLRNLTYLAEAGTIVLPASPSFYSLPADMEAACATVTERILARLGIEHDGYEWSGDRK